jgi:HEAT repeat protein
MHGIVSSHAALSLGRIGVGTESVVLALIDALKHYNPSTRTCATCALGSIRPVLEGVVPALVEALNDDVADDAALALGYIGPEAKAAVPALVDRWTRHHNDGARRVAREALSKIDPEALRETSS